MIAALQMYDWPEVRQATNLWWQVVARHLGTLKPLSRPADYTAPWRRDDLLFGQTCGYPFTHALKGKVTYVATPHYEADGCEGPNYCSIVMSRENKPLSAFRNAVAAVNTSRMLRGALRYTGRRWPLMRVCSISKRPPGPVKRAMAYSARAATTRRAATSGTIIENGFPSTIFCGPCDDGGFSGTDTDYTSSGGDFGGGDSGGGGFDGGGDSGGGDFGGGGDF